MDYQTVTLSEQLNPHSPPCVTGKNMPELLDYRRIAQERAESIAIEGAPRGFMPVDLFGALAQIVADRNPNLAFDCLRALDAIVRARPNVTPAPKVLQ